MMKSSLVKSNAFKRNLCFILSSIVSIFIPIIVTIIKYDMIHVLIKTKTSVKVSIIGASIILILFFVFFKRIMKFLNTLSFSMKVSVLKGITKLIPLVLLLLLFINVVKIIDDLVFVTGWIVGCNSISFLILDPLTEKYNYEAKRDEHRKLIKEGISNE